VHQLDNKVFDIIDARCNHEVQLRKWVYNVLNILGYLFWTLTRTCQM